MPELPTATNMANLGWLNSPSKELVDAMDACDTLGHKRVEHWHGSSACLTTVTCHECGFFYKIDSSD
jgi:hypothetical protein